MTDDYNKINMFPLKTSKKRCCNHPTSRSLKRFLIEVGTNPYVVTDSSKHDTQTSLKNFPQISSLQFVFLDVLVATLLLQFCLLQYMYYLVYATIILFYQGDRKGYWCALLVYSSNDMLMSLLHFKMLDINILVHVTFPNCEVFRICKQYIEPFRHVSLVQVSSSFTSSIVSNLSIEPKT